jgi:cell division protease FtsH
MSDNRIAAALGDSKLLQAHQADVARIRDRTRRRRLVRAIVVLGALCAYLAYRYVDGRPLRLPTVGPDAAVWLPGIILILLFGVILIVPMLGSGRSPHMLIRPEHIDLGLDEVRGLDGQVDEVVRSLNVFLGYRTFRQVLGGTPRRGILFEGPPGTGKTYLAKAMAKQASVPFLFVSAPAFQSMWFGMTNVKIRSFFKALRKAARRYGGAIGFMEEIDAIGMDRGGLAMSDRPDEDPPAGHRSISRFASSGASGMVNELLIQMQSFDQSTARQRLVERFVAWINGYLPDGHTLKAGKPAYHNILLIAATNRADALDPALLRPGRFDRRLYFDLPTKKGRRDLIDFFLDRKAHHQQLDGEEARDRVAHDTLGYTPVMIEHLFDEALLVALRDGRQAMNLSDVYSAKLTEEFGLAQPTAYTDDDRRAVATHEAGHAAAAYVLGKGRRLEVLSIIKRRTSLGLLAHSELEERFTQTREELEASLAIALAGKAAEELYLGQSGSGPASDLAAATQTAALMVGALGMAGSLISFEAVAEGAIGRRNLVGRVLGDGEAKEKVEALLQAQLERVRTVLGDNRDLVEALRDALIERDELIGEQITEVIEGALARRSETRPAADRVIDLTGPVDRSRVPGRHS